MKVMVSGFLISSYLVLSCKYSLLSKYLINDFYFNKKYITEKSIHVFFINNFLHPIHLVEGLNYKDMVHNMTPPLPGGH